MENNITHLVRPNILNMIGYKSARDEYSDSQGTFLDANESPYGTINRYPDPYQSDLKKELAAFKLVQTDEIFIGNGSDEAIDLLFRVFCEPGVDKVISFTPGYGMYQVSASIQDIENINLSLNKDFQIDKKSVSTYLTDDSVKMLFLCSPNNPTGNLIESADIQWLLDKFKGILVIDEAYIDFANSESWTMKLSDYDRLVILQTMSKAWGLAGARVGMAYANSSIISLLNKVKAPYNVSTLNQKAALEAFSNKAVATIKIKAIIAERKRLFKELTNNSNVIKVYPSEGNFLLIEIEDAETSYLSLTNQKIIVRNQSSKVRNCLRISIGTPEENKRLLDALSNPTAIELIISEYGFDSSPDLINRH